MVKQDSGREPDISPVEDQHTASTKAAKVQPPRLELGLQMHLLKEVASQSQDHCDVCRCPGLGPGEVLVGPGVMAQSAPRCHPTVSVLHCPLF